MHNEKKPTISRQREGLTRKSVFKAIEGTGNSRNKLDKKKNSKIARFDQEGNGGPYQNGTMFNIIPKSFTYRENI